MTTMTLIEDERPTPAEILCVLVEHFDAQPADVARWLVDTDPYEALREYCVQMGYALENGW